MNILELGQAFRAARIEHRLTQQDVAKGAGVSVPTVSRFERGDLLEMGMVKLLALFNLVGLDLYPRPLGQVRTLDDIQRERISDATPRGLRAAIQFSTDEPYVPGGDTRPRGLRGGQQWVTERNSTLSQRVRHPTKGKKNG
jgi:transcriptional regulator with XRE-family HTH domain